MIFFFAKSMLKLIFSSKLKIIYIFLKEKSIFKIYQCIGRMQENNTFFYKNIFFENLYFFYFIIYQWATCQPTQFRIWAVSPNRPKQTWVIGPNKSQVCAVGPDRGLWASTYDFSRTGLQFEWAGSPVPLIVGLGTKPDPT